MDEDTAGLRAAATRQSYATCHECGQVFTRQAARVSVSGLNDGARSELTELCPACDRLDRQGESPVLPVD